VAFFFDLMIGRYSQGMEVAAMDLSPFEEIKKLI
jgi:hypothetical protein